MAASAVVTCPECEKKFKPKTDVQGKKIKCPFCTKPFVVPAAAEAKDTKSTSVKAADAKVDPQPQPVRSEYDADPDPYGVKNVELVPRCPNCTHEMENEHAIICLECGYNTLTRQWGKTEKTIGISLQQHLKYLGPALGSAFFSFVFLIGMLINAIYVPYWVAGDTWIVMFDTEALRMWSTIILLGVIWGAGIFCFKKFIEKPKPDEVVVE
ncbi:MAG: hypothetical protein EXR98_00260 [Gemmataceae bacterium]|nr:hypothetical protein [Gemmataceae bacterium]